ncbi:NitT/TauT family transport system permease protein [Melghiribacillus thermohalophilus]|uniref:NitT/TauT family transport system permease protein n=1 Tax=Melghiribacillus thermohalophilus TaxID=1324956 RepID=A0A4R3MU89_9BACI|nr:ABC transporter permease [Melghiribacillus thermohalophilus]TCT17518.1 NitT/TauT family transport system permease protein [Melghiribacillus thermohalophilus]
MGNKYDELRFFQYKQKLKKERRFITCWQIFIFIMFFACWEISSRLKWIDPLIFSSPSRVANLFLEKTTDGSIWLHIQVTLLETVAGFIIGTIGGIVLAGVLWWFPKISKILDPYLVVLNAMPKVALGPIIIVALGPGYFSIIAMGVVIAIIITTIVVYSAFREVDENYVKVLRTFGASRYQIFKEAIFPASIPTMISTFKVNVGLAWVGVIVGEFLVSEKGLGYLIIYGFQVFDFTLVLFSLLLIAFFAGIMYQVVEKIEYKLIQNRSSR